MKLIRESNDFDWAMGNPNPFTVGDPLVVVWLDKTTTEYELGELWDMLIEAGIYTESTKAIVQNKLLRYAEEGTAYIKFYTDRKGIKRMSYGNSYLIFNEHKYETVEESLKRVPYKEYKLNDIFKDRLNESEDLGLDWIIESNPSFKNKIIIFEPLITEDEYNIVLDGLLKFDEGFYTYNGSLGGLRPFNSYDYLHHLVIGLDGIVAYGGANSNSLGNYDEMMDAIENYVRGNKKFNNPEIINGREYFNL